MSDENKENELQAWIEPELEARVVAWVLGEASEFEAAELERIIAEKPELAIFKRRIEAVHGLLGAASRAEADPMRLEAERREKLLEKLGSGAPAAVVAMPEPGARRRVSWKMVTGIAAALVVAALVMGMLFPALNSVGSAAREAEVQNMLAGKAKDAQNAQDLGRTVIAAQLGRVPVSLVPAPPASRESLAALDSLKAMAGRLNDEDEGGAPAGSAGAGASGAAQGGEIAQLRFERNHLEHDYAPPGAIDVLHDQARAMLATGGLASAQKGALGAERQMDSAKSAQTDMPAAALPSGNSAQADLAESPVFKTREMEGATDATIAPAPAAATATLSGANTYSGGTNISGGAMTASASASRNAYANSVPPVPEEASAAPAAPPVSMADVQDQKKLADADKDFGMAGGAEAAPGGMAGEVATGQTAGSDQNQMLALNPPAQADADLAARVLGAARRPIGKLGSPADHPPLFPPSSSSAIPGQPAATDEVSASDQPYSTFSLHVSDVSFLLAKDALANGQLPDRDSIRPEEFYNAFEYGDPAPGPGEKIACRIEQAAHPMLQQRNLVRIAMKVAATGRGQGQPLRLTVLLDTSGSMEREDRAASVQRAMEVLTSLLGPGDAVTLIGFARQPRLLAEEVRGDRAGKLVEIVRHIPAEGGTNIEEAIKAASQLALRHYEAGAQNRVVMLTDGAANLGDADPAQLALLVERLRQHGVSFDACGVGADGLNDDILEALTRKGGGRYYFLNKPEDADEGFARQLAGAFRPAAENVKMQVRFNPDRVGKYRLIGFEKHRLKQEDFRNDNVTAAQLAAEEAAVALYQVQVLPEGEGEIGEVFVRFRDPADGRMVEQSWTIPYDAQAPALDKASSSMQLAATASLVAEKLRGGPAADAIDLDALAPIVGKLRGDYAQEARVRELAEMFEEARRITGRK
jgi:autotransporter-associated beta strand protein